MNTEEIKSEILAKLKIEREVREQLERQQSEESAPTKKSSWAWLNSKLGLLLIGAVISSVLVPTFQFTQETIKWHRQNRYDSLERRLGSMRESLKQFIAVQALSAELYDLGLTVLDTLPAGVDWPQLEQWYKDFRALQVRRVQQNAAFAATMFYFPTGSQQSIQKAWDNLMLPSQQLQILVGGLLQEIKTKAGKKATVGKPAEPNKVAVQLDTSVAEINQAFERLLSILKQQLLEVEYENSRFM